MSFDHQSRQPISRNRASAASVVRLRSTISEEAKGQANAGDLPWERNLADQNQLSEPKPSRNLRCQIVPTSNP